MYNNGKMKFKPARKKSVAYWILAQVDSPREKNTGLLLVLVLNLPDIADLHFGYKCT